MQKSNSVIDNPDYFCVKCLAVGDEKAFVALYNKYHRHIYYSALKLIQSESLAQDITQNVFLKVWDNRSKLDPAQNFSAYISTICRNAIFDMFKRATYEQTVKDKLKQFAIISENELEEEDFYEEYKKILEDAIKSLPTQRRIVFERCKLQEQSYEEVAKSMGISRSTVQDHIVKANKTIKEYLQTHGNFSFAILFSILFNLVD